MNFAVERRVEMWLVFEDVIAHRVFYQLAIGVEKHCSKEKARKVSQLACNVNKQNRVKWHSCLLLLWALGVECSRY